MGIAVFFNTPALALDTGTEFALSFDYECTSGMNRIDLEYGDFDLEEDYLIVSSASNNITSEAYYPDFPVPGDECSYGFGFACVGGNEYQVVLNFDNGEFEIFKDGVSAGTEINNDCLNLDLGAASSSPYISNFVEYDHALTTEEIDNLNNNTVNLMPSFVSNLVTDVSSSSVAFLNAVITDYWLTILGVVFVGFMIGLFWRLSRRITGR